MAHKKNKGTETIKAYKCRAQRFRKLPSSEDMAYFKTAAGYEEIKKALSKKVTNSAVNIAISELGREFKGVDVPDRKSCGNDSVIDDIKSYIRKKVESMLDYSIKKDVIDTMKAYNEKYNTVSRALSDRLITTTIGDLYKYIPEGSRDTKYAQALLDPKYKDKPFWKIFNEFPLNSRNNVIVEMLRVINADAFDKNLLGFEYSSFARNGYIADVIANYASHFANMRPCVRKENINDDSTEDTLAEQVVYEKTKNELYSLDEFKNYVKYLTEKQGISPELIDRMERLFKFYKEHRDLVEKKESDLKFEEVKKFKGCFRNDDRLSMTVDLISPEYIKISPITGVDNNGNKVNAPKLHVKLGNKIEFDIMGRRDVMDNEGNLRVDLINKHGRRVVFTSDGNEIYVVFTTDVNVNNSVGATENVVGIDVNSKHAMIVTTADAENARGYVNIYAAALNDDKFMAVADAETIKTFTDLSKRMTFGQIEQDLLFSRICTQIGVYNKYSEMEKAFSGLISSMYKELESQHKNNKSCDDPDIIRKMIYLSCLNKMRSQIKGYAVLRSIYSTKQHEYDQGKEKSFIEEHPFADTPEGQDMKRRMRNCENVVEGCRNNIIEYAYYVIGLNGHDMISLEKLTSATMSRKIKHMPSIPSLLNYHKVKGHTLTEVKENPIWECIERGYYDFTMDSEGRIIDATYTKWGNIVRMNDDFVNSLTKIIKIASIKDHFLTLANNGKVAVSFIPPQFTSMIDSTDHKLYVENGKKKNSLVIVSKQKIRRTQETHINGMNADINAAENIRHIISDETFRELFTFQAKEDVSMYNVPSYDTNIRSQATIIKILKDVNAIKLLCA